MLDLQDLMAVRLPGDDARKWLNDWETTLQGMRIPPSEDVLETFFKKEIRKYSGFREHMAHYEWLSVDNPDRCYQHLVSLLRRHLESKRRDQVSYELSTRLGEPAFAAREDSDDERKRSRGECWQWVSHGKCSNGSQRPFLRDPSHAGRASPGRPGREGRTPSPRGSTAGRQSRRSPSPGPRGTRDRGRSPRSATPPKNKAFPVSGSESKT